MFTAATSTAKLTCTRVQALTKYIVLGQRRGVCTHVTVTAISGTLEEASRPNVMTGVTLLTYLTCRTVGDGRVSSRFRARQLLKSHMSLRIVRVPTFTLGIRITLYTFPRKCRPPLGNVSHRCVTTHLSSENYLGIIWIGTLELRNVSKWQTKKIIWRFNYVGYKKKYWFLNQFIIFSHFVVKYFWVG